MDAIKDWTQAYNELVSRVGLRFERQQSRRRLSAYLQGLLSNTDRKNSWQLAESLGETTPYGIQQFLYRAKWSADEVRDDLQRYVVEQLGEAEGVLVVDETGFLKQGDHSVGVQVQYSGTAGGTANSQVGVFLVYAGSQGHTFLDRALYLPRSWTDDRERCQAAGVPDEVEFATKPELALEMLQRVIDRGVPCRWVTGDSVYGNGMIIRGWLESLPLGYVLGVSRNDTVIDRWPERVKTLLDQLPQAGWQRLSAGTGSKGERLYDWFRRPLGGVTIVGWQRWLLVRRSLREPTRLSPYVCFAPTGTTLQSLVQVAGTRWTVEQCFQQAKQEVGLDEYEVRSWDGWHRHITLACLAHAFLTVVRAHGLDPLAEAAPKKQLANHPTSLADFKARRGLISP